MISLVNKKSNPTLDEASYKRIKKEIKVHKTLKHSNILELIDSLEDHEGLPSRNIPPAFYIILEYAASGDLFDQLSKQFSSKSDQNIPKLISMNLHSVPDVGLHNDLELIHFYFRQLMSGLVSESYSHSFSEPLSYFQKLTNFVILSHSSVFLP